MSTVRDVSDPLIIKGKRQPVINRGVRRPAGVVTKTDVWKFLRQQISQAADIRLGAAAMMLSKLNVQETVHRTGIRRVSGGPVVKHTGVCDNGVDFTLGNDLANHRLNIGGQGFAEFDASAGSRADPNGELPGVDRREEFFSQERIERNRD